MKIFKGYLTEGQDPEVTCNDIKLESKHSFSWEYQGEGSRHLAIAILDEIIHLDKSSGPLIIKYRDEIISKLQSPWEITEKEVLDWVNQHGGHEQIVTPKDNIVKDICKELGFTYKELGEAIGYSEPAVKKAVQTNKVSEPMLKAISLYKETLALKNQLNTTNKLKEALKDLLN